MSNIIEEHDFSNPATKELYMKGYEERFPELFKRMTEDCDQCGGCSCFAPLNGDYGICCNKNSVHFKETVFEHYFCPNHVNEGWGPHGFCSTPEELKMMEELDK